MAERKREKTEFFQQEQTQLYVCVCFSTEKCYVSISQRTNTDFNAIKGTQKTFGTTATFDLQCSLFCVLMLAGSQACQEKLK